jgi:hypothetical protein
LTFHSRRGPVRMKCIFCADTGWVCENHPRLPWEGPYGCDCGGAGCLVRPAISPKKAQRRDCPKVSKPRQTKTAAAIELGARPSRSYCGLG